MFAIVRNRRGVITAVEPSDDARHGRLHLVHVEYTDDQLPVEERLLWELEPHGRLLEPNALPNASGDPMPPDDFDALVRPRGGPLPARSPTRTVRVRSSAYLSQAPSTAPCRWRTFSSFPY